MATVDDPTEEEWDRAFHAPSRPYRWEDVSRVIVRHEEFDEPYVVKAKPEPSCECVDEIEGFAHPEYERVPIEISHHSRILSEDEKKYLEALTECVSRGNLCSKLFPCFIAYFEQSTGIEVPDAVSFVAGRVYSCDHHGVHFSPWIVELILKAYIERGDRNRASQEQKGDGSHV
jgi:hypothetical protein